MEKIDSMILKQTEINERISKAFKNFKKSPKDRITVPYIRIREETLKANWDLFNTNHYEIVAATSPDDQKLLTYFLDDAYNGCEETYLTFKTMLLEQLEKLVPTGPATKSSNNGNNSETSSGNTGKPQPDVKLPRIELPKFTGNYDEWQSFYDMFTSIVHNNSSLKEVQKLHYLKSSLSGEPELLLRNLAVTDANYQDAWTRLTQRYTNKRYNCNEMMKHLFSQKAITAESATSTKQLLDNTSACLKSLQNLDINTDTWDPIINYLVLSKLDTETRKEWEMYVSQNVQPNTLPSWNQLASFLETRFRTLEMLDGQKYTPKVTQNNTSKQIIKHKSFHSTVNNNEKKVSINTCVMCSGGHSLYQCKQYERLSPEKRTEYVQASRLCFNCLSSSHSVRGCHQSMSCRRCGRRHHTTLHYERDQQVAAAVPTIPPATPPTVLSEIQQPSEKKNSQNLSQQPNNHTESRVVAHFAKESYQGNQSKLLATALVKLVSSNVYSQLARALIDQGSEVSLITEATVQSLGLDRTPINGIICGVGEGETKTRSMVSFNIESLLNPEFSFPVSDTYVLKSLTSFLPSRKPANLDWPELDNLSLADPQYRSPGKIDVILGVDVHSGIVKEGLIKHPSADTGGPLAQNTELGWILSGRVDNEFPGARSFPISLHIRVNEDELLKRFWEIEREPDNIEKKMTEEEMRCEEIYKRTTMRNTYGRYMVRLPFKSANPECLHGNTREIALKRFTYLEKKLLRNPSLREEYTKAIDYYLIQDHMAPIVEEEQVKNPTAVYAPHHAVVREDKETTKTRLVFDFSCKGKNNFP